MGLQERLGRTRSNGSAAPPGPPPAGSPGAADGKLSSAVDAGRAPLDGPDLVDGAAAGGKARPHRTAEIRRRIHQGLVRTLGPQLYEENVDEADLERRIREELRSAIEEESSPLSATERQRLISETLDDILGNGPIEPYLRDPTVTEVMVNQFDSVYIERDGKLQRTPTTFLDDAHLRRTIEKIVGRVGRRIDEAQPYVDARLPDGSRVNAIIPPVAVDGPAITIRKFSADPYTMADLVTFGTLSAEAATFLERAVAGRMNIIVSGGTGAGKTTTLNAMSGFIPDDERIVTIEDAAELKLQQPHIVRLEYRPANIEGRGEVTIRDLVRNALRMRPDRIVVGEVRGGETLDMLQAMNTGHDGSITTVHANSTRDAMSRLETMVLMAGVDLPVRAIREQVAAGIQLIVQQARLRDGSRRITHVTEVIGMEGEVITQQDLYVFDYDAGIDENGRFLGGLVPTGIRPNLTKRLKDAGIQLPAELFERRVPARWS
jgi:pilus assembly protein CpaF